MAKKMIAPPANTGRYVFLLGLAVAVVAGIVAQTQAGLGNYAGWISLILVILGIIVGFLNITPNERHSFLVGAIALSMLGLVGFAPLVFGTFNLGAYFTSIIAYIVMFVAPAAAIAAVSEIYALAKA